MDERAKGQGCTSFGLNSRKDEFAVHWNGAACWRGTGEQESGSECTVLGVPSNTMWRPRRDPGSPQLFNSLAGGWILCGYGTQAPRKGVRPGRSSEVGGAPPAGVAVDLTWGFQTFIIKQNKIGPSSFLFSPEAF